MDHRALQLKLLDSDLHNRADHRITDIFHFLPFFLQAKVVWRSRSFALRREREGEGIFRAPEFRPSEGFFPVAARSASQVHLQIGVLSACCVERARFTTFSLSSSTTTAASFRPTNSGLVAVTRRRLPNAHETLKM